MEEERLDVILVKKGLFETRSKAIYAIENNTVYIDGFLITKSGKKFNPNVNVEIKGEVLPFVSRGGLKLDKAIQNLEITLTNKICMDIGASTGGFTDCMLQNGASKVYCVDVGHDQLDKKLRTDSRIVNLEGTNIRTIDISSFEKLDFISIDVSFISLTQVLPVAYSLLQENGTMVCLIKPQFEAGKQHLNKQGVVKDKKVHKIVLTNLLPFAHALGFTIAGLEYSPIKGPAGNIEYLLYVKKESSSSFSMDTCSNAISSTVENAFISLK